MRKIPFVLAILLAAALSLPATGLAQDLAIGVKGGLAITDLDVDAADPADEVDTETSTGLVGGAFLTIGLGERFFVQPEVLYSQKGAEFSDPVEGFTAELELDYIEVPVLFGVRFPLVGSPIEPRIFAGPAVAFEASCDVSGDEGGVSVNLDCDEFGIDTKSTDFGVLGGAGVNIGVGGFDIVLDARYVLGLADLDDTTGSEDDVKNRAFQFMGGVAFPLGL
ncbi:MAG: porin family protein [Gemmatimonadota bacterium]|nr:porin family protein [Gemmatimonadota bacterium]